jgi:hypothetical protein
MNEDFDGIGKELKEDQSKDTTSIEHLNSNRILTINRNLNRKLTINTY